MKIKRLIQITLVILFLTPIAVFSGEWTWQNRLPQGNTLNAVWGTSSTDVFAVGNVGTILHYDGTTWSAMASGTTINLYGVWGSSPTDVFAVGIFGIILHFDGSAWLEVSSVESQINYDDLYGVWGSSPTDVFAVGEYGTILHYDGSSWSNMTRGVERYFTGVWGSSPTDVFAVGNDTILHYDGTVWSPLASGEYSLNGVWGSSGSDVFAVGYGGVILHYDGSTWSAIASGTSDALNGVWGSSGTDVFAVGGSYYDGLTWKSTILHYNGSSWSLMASGTSDALNGIWGSSGSDVFAVGYLYDERGTILHYDGSSWSLMSSGTTNNLYGIWGSSGSDVFAVGVAGTILHHGGAVTLIDLSTLTATPSKREVIIKWTTESEIDNAGFNLYRAESEDGEYVKINDSLIPSEGSATKGTSYQFVDEGVKNRTTYYYKLEDIDLYGKSTMHGPVSVMPRMINGISR